MITCTLDQQEENREVCLHLLCKPINIDLATFVLQWLQMAISDKVLLQCNIHAVLHQPLAYTFPFITNFTLLTIYSMMIVNGSWRTTQLLLILKSFGLYLCERKFHMNHSLSVQTS